MAFESKDNLYVFDTQNNHIQVLNSDKYIISRGTKDIEDDEFFLVQNVVNDNKGHIYVADCPHPQLTKIRINQELVN